MKVVLRTVLRELVLRAATGRRTEGVTRRAITFAPSRGARVAVTDAAAPL